MSVHTKLGLSCQWQVVKYTIILILPIKINLCDVTGKSMVCRLIRHAIAQSDGVPSLVHLVRCVLSAGVEGRNLLTKVFAMVRQRKPNGEKVAYIKICFIITDQIGSPLIESTFGSNLISRSRSSH